MAEKCGKRQGETEGGGQERERERNRDDAKCCGGERMQTKRERRGEMRIAQKRRWAVTASQQTVTFNATVTGKETEDTTGELKSNNET